MNHTEIIHALTQFGRLPVDAIRAADADRASVLPIFLAAIETYLAQSHEEREELNPLFLIFHILGSWREKAAYRPLARLLRSQIDGTRSAVGDGAVETSHRVMAAVFDGDPAPPYDVILDPRVDEFIRSRMCHAIAMVALRGDLPRAEARRFLEACFEQLTPRTDCYVWCGWSDAIAMLGLVELRPLVLTAFDQGSIPEYVTALRFFDADLAKSQQDVDGRGWLSEDEYSLFGDTVDELSKWHGFSAQDQKDQERLATPTAGEGRRPILSVSAPIINPLRHVGRNDPCPCGSGKKYKKCCLAETT